jgi:hypothetical protein
MNKRLSTASKPSSAVTPMLTNPLHRDLLFLLALILCGLAFRYDVVLRKGPSGIHVWRQSDSLSITQNYYNGRADFLEPEIHYLIGDKGTTGKTAGEFPGLYWMNAQLWKVFGKNHGIPRLISLLITMLGLFSFYKSLLLLTGRVFFSFLWPLILFASPVLAEYGASFITDGPSFGLALIAWYFFVRFRDEDKDRLLIFSMLIFCLAGLLKMSALIIGIASMALFGLEWFGLRFGKDGVPLFRRKIKQAAIIALCFIPLIAWYVYAANYNELHGGKYTFNGVWPIWEVSREKAVQLFTVFFENLTYYILSPPAWWALIAMLLIWPLALRRTNAFVGATSLLILVGVFGYLMLWYQSIDVHDYYFVNALILYAISPLPVMAAKWPGEQKLKMVAPILGGLLLISSVFYARQNLELRHFPKERKNYLFIPKESEDIMRWYAYDLNSRTEALRNGFEEILNEAGITRETHVMVYPDITINHTLYLTDRQGITGYVTADGIRPLDRAFSRDLPYLILLDRNVYESENLEYLKEFVILSQKNADIIDLIAAKNRHSHGLPETESPDSDPD